MIKRPTCNCAKPGLADHSCRANSFPCFRFILAAAIFVLLSQKMEQARPGCDWFKNLSNGVGPSSLQRQSATMPVIGNTGAMLSIGHQAPMGMVGSGFRPGTPD